MGWHYNAFCDWAPIQPILWTPCEGGCGTLIDGPGQCSKCSREGRQKKAVQPSVSTAAENQTEAA